MKRIKIVDYYAVNTFHEVVNFSLIKICSCLFEKVQYVSGKTAVQNIQHLTHQREETLENVSYKVMPNYNADSPAGARIRDLWGSMTTLMYYIFLPYDTLLLFNYTNKISLPIILILNILLRKKIIFLFHGELEFLVSNVSYLKTAGWYKKSMQLSFSYLFSKSPVYALVLGDSIKKNLLTIYPNLYDRILSICHPYFVDKIQYTPSKHDDGIIRIGTVGTMKKSKGLKEYIMLASSLKDLLNNKHVELYSIGRVYADGIQLSDDIIWIGAKEGLPREIFEEQVQKLDYILYLYPTDSYKFTASGAILDAVKLHKPIIALKNDYFDFLMGEYPIGYVEDSLNHLEKVIRQLSCNGSEKDFTYALKTLENKITIESNANLLKKQLEKIHWL